MTKEEIIIETILFYGENPENRSINEFGVCCYKGSNGKKCAYARVIKDKFLDILNEGYGVISQPITNEHYKENYEGYSKDFWKFIQYVHDKMLNPKNKSIKLSRNSIFHITLMIKNVDLNLIYSKIKHLESKFPLLGVLNPKFNFEKVFKLDY